MEVALDAVGQGEAAAEQGQRRGERGGWARPSREDGAGAGGFRVSGREPKEGGPDEARALPPGRPSGLRPGGGDVVGRPRSGQAAVRPRWQLPAESLVCTGRRPSPGGSAWSSLSTPDARSLTATPVPVSGPAAPPAAPTDAHGGLARSVAQGRAAQGARGRRSPRPGHAGLFPRGHVPRLLSVTSAGALSTAAWGPPHRPRSFPEGSLALHKQRPHQRDHALLGPHRTVSPLRPQGPVPHRGLAGRARGGGR